MKRFSMFLMLVVAMAVAMPNSYAQELTKKQHRKIEKEARRQAKKLEKKGWEVFGVSYSLEKALAKHYEKLEAGDAREMVGVASSFISKNVGKQSAMNGAINEYARQAQSMVRGRVLSDIFINVDDVPAEFDKFYAAYESLVVKEIKGELVPSFSIIRSKGMQDGKEVFEMQTFFVIDENEAAKARLRAMESAFKESNMAQQYASKVSQFVSEGFNFESPSEE